jgi:hypothetical protein
MNDVEQRLSTHLISYSYGHGLNERELVSDLPTLQQLHARATFRDQRAGIANHTHGAEEIIAFFPSIERKP